MKLTNGAVAVVALGGLVWAVIALRAPTESAQQSSLSTGTTDQASDDLAREVVRLRADLGNTKRDLAHLRAEASAPSPFVEDEDAVHPPADEPAPARLSMAEKNVLVEKLKAQKTALFDRVIRESGADRELYQSAQEQIAASLDPQNLPGVTLLNLSCGSAMCRAEFKATSEDSAKLTLEKLNTLRYGTAVSMGEPNPDGTFRTRVYFSKADTELPSDDTEG